MEESFWAEMQQYEEDKKMDYVTSVERIGIKKGIQQGMLKTAREAVIDILEVRFDVVPQTVIKAIMEIDEPELLKRLHKRAATVTSPEEFSQVMEEIAE